ncbi:ABC transporter permease [Herbiconiux sp. SYSU D00978]|uniref:ABC transporter permease n=1 Tax=Herbiconiux sp. SYSU D00978 TaxID=2812562 RepID=UPI001A96D2D7|nr:ABC transporter permease [Herbiconiux sp. SYSU D00978]
MTGWLAGIGTVVSLELRQRVRGVAWYVLLGVFVALVAIVSLVLAASLGSWTDDAGAAIYSTVVYFVLLLATLVSPALSGNAINGDRESGTLATTQVTLISTPQLVLGKCLAAWVSSLAFLVAAVPFLVFAGFFGGVRAEVVLVSIVVLLVELGVVSALGVGLSGLLRRPLFSIVVTYLTVAMLSVGTLIAFGIAGLAIQTTATQRYESFGGPTFEDWDNTESCTVQEQEITLPRFDTAWWVLASNPYVVLADAVPTTFDRHGSPTDLFGVVKTGVRSAQLPVGEQDPREYDCDPSTWGSYPTPEQIVATTVPTWFVGLAIHVGLGVAALAGAVATTRTPSRRLAAGSRVA